MLGLLILRIKRTMGLVYKVEVKKKTVSMEVKMRNVRC